MRMMSSAVSVERQLSMRRCLPLIVVALVLSACSLADEPQPVGPIIRGADADILVSSVAGSIEPNIGNGKLIYEERCASCHALDGTSEGSEFAVQLESEGAVFPDFSNPVEMRTRSPFEAFTIITRGTLFEGGFMPPWESALSEQERWDAAYYLYMLGVAQEELARGEGLYHELLAECFPPDGALSDLATASQLTQVDLYEDFVLDTVTCPSVESLSEEEGRAVAAFMQTLATTGLDVPPSLAEDNAPVEGGLLRGRVEHANAVSLSPESIIEVKGFVMSADGQTEELFTSREVLNSSGEYVFSGLPLDEAGVFYVVTAIYAGVEYYDLALLSPGEPQAELNLTVYDVTTNPAAIEIDSLTIVVDPLPNGQTELTQVFVYNNNSDQAFVSETPLPDFREPSVAVDLPSGTIGVDFEDGNLGARFQVYGEAVYDTEPVYPGVQSHTVIAYTLVESERKTLAIPLSYPVDRISVLVPETSRLRTNGFKRTGEQVANGRTYKTYNTTDFNTDELKIKVTPSLNIPGQLLTIVVLLILLWVSILLLLKYYRHTEVSRKDASEGIIAEIAATNRAYEKNLINRFEYEAKLAELQAMLAQVASRLRQIDSTA